MINSENKLIRELNEKQKEAVLNPLKSCTKIVAGAGTGKTKIISKRFIKLVYDIKQEFKNIGCAQNHILVITFTEKAAGEMKGRILKELEANGLGDDLQDLSISTFHGFCNRILRKHAIEAGLSPDFKLADEKVLTDIYQNILKKIKYGESNEIADLQKISRELEIDEKILSIESIASLREISSIERVLDEIFGVIKQIKSLGLTPKEFYDTCTKSTRSFTKTAATVPFKFDSKEEYALNWARHFRQYLDDYCKADTSVFDSVAKEKVILDKLGKRKASEYGMGSGFPENTEKIEKIELHLIKLIAIIYAVYQNELELADLADFDDLINKTIEIFKTCPSVAEFYRDYFKHIVIDEFQDTNGAQLELIELLLNPDYANITYVGDRKQSIYGFRHAVTENLDVLHNDVQNRYSQKFAPVNLSLNYRSSEKVLNALNYITEHELGLSSEKLFAGLDLTEAGVSVTSLSGFENAFEHKIAEAKYMGSEILKLKNRDKAAFKDFAILVKSHAQADLIEKEFQKQNIPAIKKVSLSWFNEPVIKNVTALLRLVKNLNDEIAFVRVLMIRFNEAEVYRFKKSIDEKLLKHMEFEELKKLNFSQKFLAAKDELEKSDTCEFAKKLFETVFDAKKLSDNLLQTFLKLVTKITPYCAESEFSLYQAQRNLMIFEKILADFMQKEGYISISSFLDYLETSKKDKSFELPSVDDSTADAVSIMTIHASKGLEFPYVFTASISSNSQKPSRSLFSLDMQYGSKPGFGLILNRYNDKITPKSLIYREYWKKPREQNEALRLFYVAISRAKSYLNVLSFEPYGNNGAIKPAEYIQNLEEFLCSEMPIFHNSSDIEPKHLKR